MVTKAKMRLQEPAPGIIIWPEEPRIFGTSTTVFEVWHTFQLVGEDKAELQVAYDWLNLEQLDAAIRYASEHRDEMKARQEEEDARRPQNLRAIEISVSAHPAQ